MPKRLFTVLTMVIALSISSLASPKKTMAGSSSAPDKAYLQKLLDGWNAGNAAAMGQYYDQGNLVFFDIEPVKYENWAEYEKGTADSFKNYKSFKLMLNDDAQVHSSGNLAWSTATVKEDAVTTTGKHELATLRWTAIFEKENGKWMIVHEHWSEPAQ